MAKNDGGKPSQQSQNLFYDTFNSQQQQGQGGLNALGAQQQGQYQNIYGRYNEAADMQMGDYKNIMGQYQGFLGDVGPGGYYSNMSFGGGGGGVGGSGLSGEALDPFGSEYAGYKNFAEGGGGVNYGNVDVNQFGNEYDLYNQMARNNVSNFNPEMYAALNQSIAGYGDFARTGGFSPQDIQDIRARAIAPTRAVYANAQANLDRSRSLQGASPNYAAAQAKMARELAYGISDANVNANASIAQLVQQGKLAGLQGLQSASLGGQNAQQQIDQLNAQSKLVAMSGMSDIDKSRLQGMISNAQGQLQANEFSRQMQLAGLGGMSDIDKAKLSAALQAAAIGASSRAASAALDERWQEALLGGRLQGMGGMTNLFGTTPGLTNMFGQQLLATSGQQLDLQGLQNQFSLGLINAAGQNEFANKPTSSGEHWYNNIPGFTSIGLNALKYLGIGGGGGSDSQGNNYNDLFGNPNDPNNVGYNPPDASGKPQPRPPIVGGPYT